MERREPRRKETDPESVRYAMIIHPANCGAGYAMTIDEETRQGLGSYDLNAVPAFISAYTNLLQMVRWLSFYELERAEPFGKSAMLDLEETLRHSQGKLAFEDGNDAVPASYHQATEEGIGRLEQMKDQLATLLERVEAGADDIDEPDVWAVLERFHQHTVDPPNWQKIEAAGSA